MATTKSVFAKLKGGASLAAFAKLSVKKVNIIVKNKNKLRIENFLLLGFIFFWYANMISILKLRY